MLREAFWESESNKQESFFERVKINQNINITATYGE